MLVVRSNIGTTGLFRLLKSTTPEQLVNPKPNAVPYSFETQQKHRWAYRLWEFSLSKTLRGALFALNSIHTGQPTLEFLKWTIKGAVDLAKNSEPTPDTSYEKHPSEESFGILTLLWGAYQHLSWSETR
ncbi:hypothetical protein BLNAU_1815 [Blattamonas nauphoetae]|uniref:Uncharacterized protein n=1 Tax=Blattamonas nauphoetae TaxID=2049346 RepID=A0ABQ9YHR7_9EUKA|nr:hypothetical protein BLNAU_1815 [Blattamonas nauphoetae]